MMQRFKLRLFQWLINEETFKQRIRMSERRVSWFYDYKLHSLWILIALTYCLFIRLLCTHIYIYIFIYLSICAYNLFVTSAAILQANPFTSCYEIFFPRLSRDGFCFRGLTISMILIFRGKLENAVAICDPCNFSPLTIVHFDFFFHGPTFIAFLVKRRRCAF